jgi:hypothetical protein
LKSTKGEQMPELGPDWHSDLQSLKFTEPAETPVTDRRNGPPPRASSRRRALDTPMPVEPLQIDWAALDARTDAIVTDAIAREREFQHEVRANVLARMLDQLDKLEKTIEKLKQSARSRPSAQGFPPHRSQTH